VKGKTESQKPAKEEYSREFTRDFTLPLNVDPFSIKAQLDEATRQLSLIGQVTNEQAKLTQSMANASLVDKNAKIGSIREVQADPKVIDYEVFLGNELKDGKSTIELSSYNTLTIRVVKSDRDAYGDVNLELKRQIKLPVNANAQNIEHGIDSFSAILIVKVPLK
jgi:HSP20 family molecular chaperone IbpA